MHCSQGSSSTIRHPPLPSVLLYLPPGPRTSCLNPGATVETSFVTSAKLFLVRSVKKSCKTKSELWSL